MSALPSLERGVLHVITGLDSGGAETQLAGLALASHRAGKPVVVASLLPGGAHRKRLEEASVPVLDLGLRRGRVSPLAALALARLIRRLRPAAPPIR